MTIFDDVRERVSLTDAVSFLGMQPTERKGDQLRFKCPACKSDDRRALSVNLTQGFRCFAGDKKGNDATSLVAHCLNIRQRDAADQLAEHFLRSSSTKPDRKVEPGERGESSNALSPLDYLEPSHEVIEMLGVTINAMEALGAGYAPKGTMAGRICIPLRLPDGELIGYFGIATKADMAPLLLFPNNLDARVRKPEKKEPDELRKLLRVV